jgi:hypothetical protein
MNEIDPKALCKAFSNARKDCGGKFADCEVVSINYEGRLPSVEVTANILTNKFCHPVYDRNGTFTGKEKRKMLVHEFCGKTYLSTYPKCFHEGNFGKCSPPKGKECPFIHNEDFEQYTTKLPVDGSVATQSSVSRCVSPQFTVIDGVGNWVEVAKKNTTLTQNPTQSVDEPVSQQSRVVPMVKLSPMVQFFLDIAMDEKKPPQWVSKIILTAEIWEVPESDLEQFRRCLSTKEKWSELANFQTELEKRVPSSSTEKS